VTKLIALDDGHGMETAGKRTPKLPDGSVMRENEFNRRVVQLCAVHLMRCGFDVLLVAPTDVDTPLSVRTSTANKAKAHLYVSVHANACGAGELNAVRGIETFHMAGSVQSQKAAQVLHKHLIGGTKLPDRGVKTANFYVLRETNMPSVLVECGFMTNIEDAYLLKSEVYRAECALELAQGICEYFGVPFVPQTTAKEDKPVNEITVIVNGQPLTVKGEVKDGVTRVPARELATALGAKVVWDKAANAVHINK